MKIIELTRGKVTIVDDDVYEWASKFKWHVMISRGTTYAVRSVRTSSYKLGKKKYYWLHREVMQPDTEMEVDHEDGDGLNNLRENLRVVTGQQNKWAYRKPKINSISKFRGVGWDSERHKWVAKLATNRKLVFFGRFESEEAAALAWDAAAITHRGEYAQLNFPCAKQAA